MREQIRFAVSAVEQSQRNKVRSLGGSAEHQTTPSPSQPASPPEPPLSVEEHFASAASKRGLAPSAQYSKG